MLGFGELWLGFWPEFAPVQVGYHFAADANTVHFVLGKIIAEPRNLSVHISTSKFFRIGVFIGCHLDQWRAAQGHHGLICPHDVVVAHARLVSATSGGCTEDHRYCWNTNLRQLRDFIKQAARFGKVVYVASDVGFRCGVRVAVTAVTGAAQVGPSAFDKLHIGHAIFSRNFQSAHQFFRVERVKGTGTHRWVMAQNDALHAFYDANANHKA